MGACGYAADAAVYRYRYKLPSSLTNMSFCICADLFNDPDYQYLVRHNGEPNLSLLGGPAADITPASLLNKLMLKWSKEADESPDDIPNPEFTKAAFSNYDSNGVLSERWQTPADDLLPNCNSSSGDTAVESHVTAARGRRKGVTSSRTDRLKPSAEAFSMANTGLPSFLSLHQKSPELGMT